jgi:hypothetical protein
VLDQPEHDPAKTLSLWVHMWQEIGVNLSDVGYVLQRLTAETGDPSLFRSAPVEVQEELLNIIERFVQTGKQELGVVGGSKGFLDTSDQVRECKAILERAGLLPT